MVERDTYWFEYDLAARRSLAEEYLNIPLTFLDLSVRTRNALRRHDKAMDVANLLCIDASIQQIRGVGVGMLREINEQFMPLVEGAEIALAINETVTMEVTEPITSYTPLPEAIAELSIGVLHLPKRAFGTLERVGIKTIGEVERVSVRELEKIPNLGSGGLSIIYERISALRDALDEESGQVDWCQFWISQEIDLIPAEWTPGESLEAILARFPSIIEEVLSMEDDERAWYIVKRRFGLDGRPTLTLDELGTAFSLTRERVRQIEEKKVRHFGGMLLGVEYSGKSYHIQPEVIEAFGKLAQEIKEAVSHGIPETDLRKRLITVFQVSEKTLNRVLGFILAICDVQQLNIRFANLEPILYSTTTAFPANMESIILIVHRFLTHQAASASDVDILIEVNQQLGKKSRIQLADLRMVVPLCKTIEVVAAGIYRGRFEHLSTRADQIERILDDAGKPLSIAEICREMNYRALNSDGQTIDERNLTNQMTSSDRFSPIGRSGYWTLTQWAAETGNIIDIMKQYLMTKNTPATADEITTYVQGKRPASTASIRSYLAFDAAFAQVTRSTWGLSSWEEVKTAKTWNPEEVAEFVDTFFRTQKTRRIEYKVLKQALMAETGYSAARVQGLLNLSPAISTEMVGSRKRIAVFQANYKERLRTETLRFKRKKKTLFEQIEEDIQAILASAPGHQMGLSSLIEVLTEKYGSRYKKPYYSLHNYISRMDFIEKVPIEGSRLLMCRLVTEHDVELKTRTLNIPTPSLRESVLRSLTFLTENDVDVALFLLSKEFEATLKRYVQSAIKVGELVNPDPKGRLSLNGMISMVSNANILTDDAVLSFLRQSRNDRAHGAMPSVEERRMMMSQIGVTAGMYIDYIQFFDDLTLELEASS